MVLSDFSIELMILPWNRVIDDGGRVDFSLWKKHKRYSYYFFVLLEKLIPSPAPIDCLNFASILVSLS